MTDAVFERHNVETNMRRPLARAYQTFADNAEEDDAATWTLSGDDYYDLLEGLTFGHRRFKTWIREKRAGDTVTLTTAGASLFNDLAADERERHETAKRAHDAGRASLSSSKDTP